MSYFMWLLQFTNKETEDKLHNSKKLELEFMSADSRT